MDAECLFCRIAQRKLPAVIVSESERWIAFRDAQPQAPVHVLIVPKIHLSNLTAATPEHQPLLGSMLTELARIAGELGVAASGFRIVNNCNRNGGQTVGHLHFHLLAGRAMQWPPG